MLDLVIRPMADAFMQVGVFVALLAAPFGWARYRWGGRFDAVLARHRRLGPVVAALLTVPPGCGGAIVVMSVYARGAVTYGAAVSALVATMGDACWVLLAAEPVLTLKLKVLLVTTGVVTGYVVDALGVDPFKASRTVPAVTSCKRPSAHSLRAVGGGSSVGEASFRPTGGRPALVAAPRAAVAIPASHVGLLPSLLWALLVTGLVVSMPVTFQLLDPVELGDALLGGVDPYLAVGAVGTAVCLIAFVRQGSFVADDDLESASPSSSAQVLLHAGKEVAFVTIWVAFAYIAWAVFSTYSGFDPAQLPVLGVAGVVVGALVGLIPGCAVQIVFAGIFLTGGMPLSTLVANTVSQDGDALIPLLAMQRRSALMATVITTIPALVVGSGLLLLS